MVWGWFVNFVTPLGLIPAARPETAPYLQSVNADKFSNNTNILKQNLFQRLFDIKNVLVLELDLFFCKTLHCHQNNLFVFNFLLHHSIYSALRDNTAEYTRRALNSAAVQLPHTYITKDVRTNVQEILKFISNNYTIDCCLPHSGRSLSNRDRLLLLQLLYFLPRLIRSASGALEFLFAQKRQLRNSVRVH